jgi:hypothetical protein
MSEQMKWTQFGKQYSEATQEKPRRSVEGKWMELLCFSQSKG